MELNDRPFCEACFSVFPAYSKPTADCRKHTRVKECSGESDRRNITEDLTLYLVNTIRFHSEFPSETLGGVGLRAVLGQLALILVAYGRLRHGNTTHTSVPSHRQHHRILSERMHYSLYWRCELIIVPDLFSDSQIIDPGVLNLSRVNRKILSNVSKVHQLFFADPPSNFGQSSPHLAQFIYRNSVIYRFIITKL